MAHVRAFACFLKNAQAQRAILARPPVRRMGAVSSYKPPTMDEIPIPQGSWAEHVGKRQAKNNMVLIAGIVWFAFSAAVFVNTPGIDFVWGPKEPAPRE